MTTLRVMQHFCTKPDLTVISAASCVVFQIPASCTGTAGHRLPTETSWAEFCSGARPICVKDKEMTDSLARLSAATRFPRSGFSHVQVLPTPQVRCWTPAEHRPDKDTAKEKPGEKAEWSEGPFPTLFLAPVSTRRLGRTLPKQRDCLCRCPNSRPTLVCTLAHGDRDTLRRWDTRTVILIPPKSLFEQLFSVNTGSDGTTRTFGFRSCSIIA